MARLVGIVTNRDLQFETDLDRDIKDVMTRDRIVTAPVGTTLKEAERVLHRHRIEKLPVVDDDGRLRGLITVKDIFKRRRHPNACKDGHGRLRGGRSRGRRAGGHGAGRGCWSAPGWDALVIDTRAWTRAGGCSTRSARVREAFPDIDIVAGNVATAEAAEALVERGADAVKVGGRTRFDLHHQGGHGRRRAPVDGHHGNGGGSRRQGAHHRRRRRSLLGRPGQGAGGGEPTAS